MCVCLLYRHHPSLLSQLALSYPIDEEKARAKFDKPKKVLTVTLPVVPLPETRPQQQPPTAATDPVEVQEEEERRVETNGQSLCEEVADRAAADNGPGEGEEVSQESSVDLQESQELEPEAVVAPQTQGHWVSKGEWVCPAFSYRQEDTLVVFCLHTPQTTENSIVKCFSEHSVSFSTTLESTCCCF